MATTVEQVKGAEDAGIGLTKEFLDHLYAQLRDAFTDGTLSREEFDAAMRKARGHAGGTASAAKRRQGDEWIADPYVSDVVEPPMDMPKLEKADSRVNYRDAETVGMTCGDCRFYAAGACVLVEGSIASTTVCDLFSAPMAYSEPLFMKEADVADICADRSSWRLFIEEPRLAGSDGSRQ